MKKATFIEGTIIATLCIIISKVLGVIYVIPFYSLIGEQGGALYGYAYSIYGLFLNLSTAGIPFAISKITSEYDVLKQNYLKEKSYKVAKYIMCILGVICFIVMVLFASFISDAFIGNITGGNTKEDVTFVIRMVSTALLIVPILSVTRGYLQGHKFIAPSSISQVIEQFVRVLIIVLGSYLCLRVLNLSLRFTIGLAVFSATISALIAYIYLKIKSNKAKKELSTKAKPTKEELKISTKDIAIKLMSYAIPFILIDVVGSMYSFVDLTTINKTMVSLGYSITESESVISVLTTWGAKLNTIVIAISSGMIVSLVPNIASALALKKYDEARDKINEAMSSLIFVILPMTVGLSLIAEPVWTVFFGANTYVGILVFSYSIYTAFTMSLFNITTSSMHSCGYSKLVILTLFLGLIVKASLNVVLMELFNSIGIHPSYGVITCTILSNLVAVGANMYILKRKIGISFKDTFKKVLKTLIPLSFMIIAVLLIRLIMPTSYNRFVSLGYCMIYATIGSAIYIFVSIKTKIVYDIFGKDIFIKIKNKLKRK